MSNMLEQQEFDYNTSAFHILKGKKIEAVYMNENFLVFKTSENKYYGYSVWGDCCSHSYFHDFVAVEKLIQNNEITQVNALPETDATAHDADYIHDLVRHYGYEFVSISELWGEQTSVMSFRNASNGYYGGECEPYNGDIDLKQLERIA